jgi:hypothetical protein
MTSLQTDTNFSVACHNLGCDTLEELFLYADQCNADAFQTEQEDLEFNNALEDALAQEAFDDLNDDYADEDVVEDTNSDTNSYEGLAATVGRLSSHTPCRYGDACRNKTNGTCYFSHEPIQRDSHTSIRKCQNGPTCPFNAKGICRFGH